MKIKVITYHAVLNYGAALQSYALQKYLSSKGSDVQIIDFRREEDKDAYRILKAPKNVKGLLKFLLGFVHYSRLRLRAKRFAAFLEDNVSLTSRYVRIQDFESNPLQADLFITGSDQVWNCSNHIVPEFFLDFDVGTARRASYAASIGVSSIPEVYREAVSRMLKRFDAISVREKDAQRILRDELEAQAVVVCDPVLLLDKSCWEGFLRHNEHREEKYILCYALLSNAEVKRCIDEVKNALNLPVYIISGSGYLGLQGNKIIRDAGPIEFLNWLYNAEYVICCSFHGTVFSTIFNKRFVSVIDRSKPSRVVEFLSEVGRTDCIYSEGFAVDNQHDITPNDVEKRLERLRQTGVDFLDSLIRE